MKKEYAAIDQRDNPENKARQFQMNLSLSPLVTS